jgi:hypothetical protein
VTSEGTYGVEPTSVPVRCGYCPAATPGWVEKRREGASDVLHPCPACQPITYARWKAGHLGCHRPDCDTCAAISGPRLDAPPQGGARYLD